MIVPVATLVAKSVSYLVALEPGDEWQYRKLLVRDHSRPGERLHAPTTQPAESEQDETEEGDD